MFNNQGLQYTPQVVALPLEGQKQKDTPQYVGLPVASYALPRPPNDLHGGASAHSAQTLNSGSRVATVMGTGDVYVGRYIYLYMCVYIYVHAYMKVYVSIQYGI